MLDHADATRFIRPMSTGKTKPVMLACERDNGNEIEVVAKFSRGCNNSTEPLVREAIAAMFAKDLGLPVPEPFVVEVSDAFIAAVPDASVRGYLHQSIRLGFGSQKLPDGFNVWSFGAAMPDSALQEAREIVAFDALVTNADRRPTNPNLLFNGRTFAIFDHEMAFMTNLNMFWREPWVGGAMDPPYSPKDHVLYPSIRQAGEVLDLQRLQATLGNITDQRIAEYGHAVAPEWIGNADAVTRALELIRGLRDNAAPAVDEFKRAFV